MATRSTRRNGPPPVPAERARARGNPGKKPLPKAGDVTALPSAVDAPAGEVPKPPLPLKAKGMALWRTACVEARSWLAPTDALLLAMVCQDVDERESIRLSMARSKDWRLRVALRALDKQITDRLQLLGFTPADRTRMKAGEVQPEDELAKFRAEAAARLAAAQEAQAAAAGELA